jgi:hypothetical protein
MTSMHNSNARRLLLTSHDCNVVRNQESGALVQRLTSAELGEDTRVRLGNQIDPSIRRHRGRVDPMAQEFVLDQKLSHATDSLGCETRRN